MKKKKKYLIPYRQYFLILINNFHFPLSPSVVVLYLSFEEIWRGSSSFVGRKLLKSTHGYFKFHFCLTSEFYLLQLLGLRRENFTEICFTLKHDLNIFVAQSDDLKLWLGCIAWYAHTSSNAAKCASKSDWKCDFIDELVEAALWAEWCFFRRFLYCKYMILIQTSCSNTFVDFDSTLSCIAVAQFSYTGCCVCIGLPQLYCDTFRT